MSPVEGNENPFAKGLVPFAKGLVFPRTSADVVCELANERREISDRLDKLYKAIAANPETVSVRHKDLWKMQAKAMQEYVDVLSERIKDLIDSDT